MIRLAPDFSNWASSPISFRPSHDELLEFLNHQLHQFWSSLLAADSGLFLNLLEGSDELSTTLNSQEIQAAHKDIKAVEHQAEATWQAGLELLWGRNQFIRDEVGQAVDYYQNSLTVLQSDHDFHYSQEKIGLRIKTVKLPETANTILINTNWKLLLIPHFFFHF